MMQKVFEAGADFQAFFIQQIARGQRKVRALEQVVQFPTCGVRLSCGSHQTQRVVANGQVTWRRTGNLYCGPEKRWEAWGMRVAARKSGDQPGQRFRFLPLKECVLGG